MSEKQKFIRWFSETSKDDVGVVGGKNASLGEMFSKLTAQGINIPDGFATTAEAYFYFLEKSGLKERIGDILREIRITDIRDLQKKGNQVRSLILKADLPADLAEEIITAYGELSRKYNAKNADVAVRSSATAEDLPNASFAGQQETFLNIAGGKAVLKAVKECFASLFTDRAIVYREEMKFDHLKVGLSAGIQKMIRSDLASSGVMFSCDTESGFGDVILINASYGLGENVVKGRVNPDQYYVFQTTLKEGFSPIIERKLGTKEVKMVYSDSPKSPTKNIPVSLKDRQRFVLKDEEMLTLGRWAVAIEDHYGREMDMEWAKDGKDGKLYIVQARPETVKSRKNVSVLEEYQLDKSRGISKVLVAGLSVGSKIGQGRVRKIMDVKEIEKFKKGEVLVTDMTDPDWVPVMKMASAIVTDSGSRTCHAAIVSRELGIPCVVGAQSATRVLRTGQAVTVSCAEGETGKIFEGIIPFEIKTTNIANLPKPPVKIMMNLGEPEQAFTLSFHPNDGIGLAREEFIIANRIKIHPLALINYRKLPTKVKKQIDREVVGFVDKTQFFVDRLAEGIGKIASAFYPKPVIIRFSDFKSNEYAQLIGGDLFEPREENPMLGWRGASRYYDPRFRAAFLLECQALKKAREKFGLSNIWAMVPFCRTPEEGKKVLEIMKEGGLEKGANGLKVIVMAEIPSNVILSEEFLEIFDGMSIGSNDLTQLTLGLDRDSGSLSGIGDERNRAVKKMIAKVIKDCKDRGKYVGICGDAPSTFPDFAKFLIERGIESISLNPDAVIKTILEVAPKEGTSI
ncbi:MAG: phosphoenolpyruvate synthase [Candidatus Nealsonbacteria bacterium]|nr:phosphoenolpyruvate synthase [Candidatus Nealsonbacteria bacterium]